MNIEKQIEFFNIINQLNYKEYVTSDEISAIFQNVTIDNIEIILTNFKFLIENKMNIVIDFDF